MRGVYGLVVGVVLVAGALVGCSPDVTPAVDAQVTFESVVDGDTIKTSAGTVRVIGIDAPERGECGYAEASALVSSLLSPGDVTILTSPVGENDADRYGRILRYVDTALGVDMALTLLAEGLAVARYDSTDGYPAHERESDYHAAQIASLSPEGAVTAVACTSAAETAEDPRIVAEQDAADAPTPPAAGDWWTAYPSCVKVKRNTAGHPTGPFSRDDSSEAAIYEWFANGTGNNGDGDRDGLACE